MVISEDEPDVPEYRRVRYLDDKEARHPRAAWSGMSLTRTASAGSTRSASSARSRRSLRRNPSLAILIEHRSISFTINDSNERQLGEVRNARDKATAELNDLDWHTIAVKEVYRRLLTSPEGLTGDHVQPRLKTYGRNVPTLPKSHLARAIF